MEHLAHYCAPGVRIGDQMAPVSEGVRLRVIHFSPAEESPFPPVIFVPGWITQMDAWQTVLREMTQDFNIYYVETREKMSSRVDKKSPISVRILGSDLARLVEFWGFADKSYILMGSSLGATAILESYHHLKSSPLCNILIGPNASFHIPKAGLVIIRVFHPGFYLLIKPVIKWYLKTFRLDSATDYAQYRKYCNAIDAADPYKLKKMALSMPGYHVWDVLEQIAPASLLIGASKDLLHDRGTIEKMSQQLQQGSYLDLQTNARTHSTDVVAEIRQYVRELL